MFSSKKSLHPKNNIYLLTKKKTFCVKIKLSIMYSDDPVGKRKENETEKTLSQIQTMR